MTQNENCETKLITRYNNATIKICYPKEKTPDEEKIVREIKEMMESLILNQFNQADKNKGEALYGYK